MSEPTEPLNESDLALIDALTALTDLLIGAGALKVESVQNVVQPRIQMWEQKGKLKTATILGLWRAMTTDPEFRKRRENDLGLRAMEPKGKA